MKSVTTEKFRALFAQLPIQVQHASQKAYKHWKDNPNHPAVQFKLVVADKQIYSARVSLAYRALCVKHGEVFIWFWIGSHAEYDRLIKQ